MYYNVSTLLAKGVVFSTFDRPQKYYALSVDGVIDSLVQAAQNALQTVSEKKRHYQKMVETMLDSTFVPEPINKESYQIIMGKNAVNGKIKRMLAAPKKQVLLIVGVRMLASMFHSDILDRLTELGSNGIEVILRTPSKDVADYLGQYSNDLSVQANTPKTPVLVTKICPISVDLVIVDHCELLLLFKSYTDPGTSNEPAGIWTNGGDLVAFCKYLFETLP